MSKPKKPASSEAEIAHAPGVSDVPDVPQWSPEELLAVAHLGPAIIGREMYEAAQAYKRQHGQNALGPATRGE